MLFAKVRKEIAEETRQQLIKDGALSKDYKIIRDEKFIYFPLTKEMRGKFEIVDLEAQAVPFKYLKLEELLTDFLTKEEMEQVVTSFDLIGDLIIVEIPGELESKEKQIAKSILEVHRNCKVVAKKTGAMSGEFRTRPLKVIEGENRTETVYKESGVAMKLDPSKVYFSIRLSTERKRIADQVKPGERILALFAGVGPFPLVISKTQPDCEIVAIELNPEAVKYMEENVKLNKCKNILPILGDAREIVMKNYLNWADRIIMPLPHKAETFLDVAFAGARNGCIIHFYGFVSEKDVEHAFEDKIREACKKQDTEHKTLDIRVVRPYAPGIVQVVVDLKIAKGIFQSFERRIVQILTAKLSKLSKLLLIDPIEQMISGFRNTNPFNHFNAKAVSCKLNAMVLHSD
jgi:tRNA (guanine37-N1)-methyltransferase